MAIGWRRFAPTMMDEQGFTTKPASSVMRHRTPMNIYTNIQISNYRVQQRTNEMRYDDIYIYMMNNDTLS